MANDFYGEYLLSATVLTNTIPVNGAATNDGNVTWVSTFTTGDSPAGEGYPLRIEIVGSGVQSLYDNVKLTKKTGSVGGSVIATLAPTAISSTTATLNASLNASGTNYDIYVYCGTNDGGTNASSWAETNAVGSFTNVSTTVSYISSNLTAGQTYYYTFMASNSSGVVWASPSWRFSTPGVFQACTLTVDSVYGSATPFGVTSPASNSVVNAWVSGSPVTLGTTQYVCTGWIGTGSVPASGTNTSTSFTITEDTTITWTWSTNYWIELGTSVE